ncbi:MAG: NADH:flavin oxidoreductase [Candidatus Riflebacteria bacterium]|nr:NADH:flavin oxidoreductase [Candidatus Riflebacteria bacterium]
MWLQNHLLDSCRQPLYYQSMISSLLSPFNLGNRELKNRMIATPPPSLTCDPGGLVTSDTVEYYQRLAETGVSAVIVEGAAISQSAITWVRQLDISNVDVLGGLSQLAEKIRRGGALPLIQLYHGGFNALRTANVKLYGAGKPSLKKVTANVHPLTAEMINQVIKDYIGAAIVAWNAGFSGIEIQGAEGSLIQQFLSPLTNPRNDEYGLQNANGALFVRQIIRGIKSATPDLTLSLRISLKDLLPGGAGLSQATNLANLLKSEGVDIFHITEGLVIGNPLHIHPVVGKNAPEMPFSEDAAIFRHEIKHPLILSGKVGRPGAVNLKINRDLCDFVALGRTINRNPNWPAQAVRPNDIVEAQPCLRCKVCIAATRGCPDRNIPFTRML